MRKPPGPAVGVPPLRTRLLLVLALCAILALVARTIVGDRGIFEVWRKKSAHARLSAEVEALREENVALNKQIRALRSDPTAIERIAREELGYCRPGEITFVFREDRAPKNPATP